MKNRTEARVASCFSLAKKKKKEERTFEEGSAMHRETSGSSCSVCVCVSGKRMVVSRSRKNGFPMAEAEELSSTKECLALGPAQSIA